MPHCAREHRLDGVDQPYEVTLLVRKAGSAPTSRRDGTIVLDSKTRDAYKNTYFCDSGLSNGTKYYYKFFPYTTANAYTDSTDDEFNAIPTVQVAGITSWNVTGMSASSEAGNGKMTVKWTDPSASISADGVTLASWASTTIVVKSGSYPTNKDDSGAVYTLKVTTRNRYSSTPLTITGLTNGTKYYIAFFPETTDGGINTSTSQRTTGAANRIGFNHNSSKEGNGITFGTFKTALSGGTDICLVDGNYGGYSTNGTKYFNMNHSSNTNAGGWKGCDLRYDVLGSTNTNDGDATATTATNPVANTLMAALPSDLRAVMQPMTIYTDNTGGGSDNASYVTKTTDYLPLLAEYEIFGTRSYANSAEKNYQAQYAYYSAGNSKVKYRHSATGSTAWWWERSPYYSTSTAFCHVNTSGGASYDLAGSSYGVAPAFRV